VKKYALWVLPGTPLSDFWIVRETRSTSRPTGYSHNTRDMSPEALGLPKWVPVAARDILMFINLILQRTCRDSKKKVKESHNTPMEAQGGAGIAPNHSNHSFTTSALDGGEWSASFPGRALPPGKGPPVPIVQEAGWAHSRSGHRG
jgi:hypothetical protein